MRHRGAGGLKKLLGVVFACWRGLVEELVREWSRRAVLSGGDRTEEVRCVQCIEEEEGARACVVRGRQRSCLRARSRAQKSNAAGWPRRAADGTVFAGDAPAMGRDGERWHGLA